MGSQPDWAAVAASAG